MGTVVALKDVGLRLGLVLLSSGLSSGSRLEETLESIILAFSEKE